MFRVIQLSGLQPSDQTGGTMGFQRRGTRRRRANAGGVFRVEALEQRALLAASGETFNGPSLNDLIVQAQQGTDTAPAAIDRMLSALESQLTSGPLADLTAGTVDGNGFVTEVQSLVSSYTANVDKQLLPEFPNVTTLLQLQGERIVAVETSLNQQNSVGLLSDIEFGTQAQTAINSLTAGPLFSLGTPLSGYASATQAFEAELNTISQSLGSAATTPLSAADASTTMQAETLAYQTDIHAAMQVTHPNISNTVDIAVANLENIATSIATLSATAAQTAVNNAITAFDNAILGTNGVFGPKGIISASLAAGTGFSPTLTDTRDSSSLSDVSGTATFGGTATLTATLTSGTKGTPISGVTVAFSLDGAFAGLAVTSSSGVATLSGVPTSAAVGTDTGGVLAYYAGSIQNKTSAASGDLTVSQSATSLSAVSGTATFGGTATLTATLKSSATSQALSGQNVSFTLDGTSVGTATTDSNGVATLSGVTTTDAAGTHTGVVEASFAGNSGHGAATNATGDLTVSKSDTTLGTVSGAASFGGTATLTATLTSSTTSHGISGETVTFTLDGTSVGTAMTNSSGVATLTGVATSDPVGTHTGVVVASFAGDSNYNAAANGTGDLTVSKSDTTLGSVSGAASFGGTATLTATLTSSTTSHGISGETVTFTLDGTSVGTAMTNSSGVATLTGVATSDPVGTHTGVVVASFAGDSNYNAATNGTGDLTVSQATTSITSVSGTLSSGTANLTATLMSTVTNQGISGVSVEFTIGTTDVGPATTDSNGVATLSVSTTATSGTAVAAAFAGNTDYTSSNGSGTLT
jgi:hypothetical protein